MYKQQSLDLDSLELLRIETLDGEQNLTAFKFKDFIFIL